MHGAPDEKRADGHDDPGDDAENGVDAVKILSQPIGNTPDIIFLDINMPVMDGFETLVEIRKDKRYRNAFVDAKKSIE